MFRTDDIRARLQERPFRPFRVIASEGLRYDIHHPDLILLGVRDMMVGFAGPDDPAAYDRVTRVAYVHVVGLEDLQPASAPPAGDQD